MKEPQPHEICTQLNDILKGYVELNHPLCHSCSNILYEQLNNELMEIDKEIDWHKEVLNTLETYSKDGSVKQNELLQTDIHNKIEQVELEHEKVDKEYKEALDEYERLNKLEKKLKDEYNAFKSAELEENLFVKSLQNQLNYLENEIDKWSKTDSLSFVFHISFENHFGLMNGYRLGRISALPDTTVPWSEINAAWGQTLHLLQSLSRRLGYTFKRYELLPQALHSSIKVFDESQASSIAHDIDKITDVETLVENLNLDPPEKEPTNSIGKILPLYYTGGFKFFWDTKFDQAMLAFLECLTEISEELTKRDNQFKLPYKIEKGRLLEPSTTNSYSIKVQFNSEENWTKALKYTLTNLQWIQTCVSSLR